MCIIEKRQHYLQHTRNARPVSTDQEESSAVVVLLQEFVLALHRFVGDQLRIQLLFLASLFFRHVMNSFKILLVLLNPATDDTSRCYMQSINSMSAFIEQSVFECK